MVLEGGDFRCDPTGYKTTSVNKWNEHCINECDLHGETGSTACITCGVGIEYKHIPFFPLAEDGSKNIQLQCPDCSERTRGKGQITTAAAPEELEEKAKGRAKK
jgi:DNA-directed RNA polymerase subunit RPC12/RpoP